MRAFWDCFIYPLLSTWISKHLDGTWYIFWIKLLKWHFYKSMYNSHNSLPNVLSFFCLIDEHFGSHSLIITFIFHSSSWWIYYQSWRSLLGTFDTSRMGRRLYNWINYCTISCYIGSRGSKNQFFSSSKKHLYLAR